MTWGGCMRGAGNGAAGQFWTFTMSNNAMPQGHRGQATKPPHAIAARGRKLVLLLWVFLRTIRSLLPFGGGVRPAASYSGFGPRWDRFDCEEKPGFAAHARTQRRSLGRCNDRSAAAGAV